MGIRDEMTHPEIRELDRLAAEHTAGDAGEG